MDRNIILWVLCIFIFKNTQAQSYSSDVELIEKKQYTVVLRSSGIAIKKKDASVMAVKSVFHTYFFVGIPGLNKNKPLMSIDQQEEFRDYLNRFFEEGRYINFIREVVEIERPLKLPTKEYRVTVRLELLEEALYRDLMLNKIIPKSADKTSLAETGEQIILPTIMVVPYRKEGESFASVLQNNFDIRTAISAVQQGFHEKGVSTIDFEAKYKAVLRAAEYETNTLTSVDKELLRNSGADVWIEVDIEKDIAPTGSRVALVLKAIETASGNVLATKQATSNRFRVSAVDQLCRYIVEDIREDFLKQVARAMAEKIDRGNTIVLHIAVDKNAILDMDSEIGSRRIPLSDLLRIWVKKNARNGIFHVQGSNSESIVFDQIQIDNKAEDGNYMDVNDFALHIFMYLRSQKINCEKKVDGNTIYITVI